MSDHHWTPEKNIGSERYKLVLARCQNCDQTVIARSGHIEVDARNSDNIMPCDEFTVETVMST